MAFKDAIGALRAEVERLRQSSNIFSALMDDPGRAVAILSPDRHLVWTNDTLAAWFPYYDPACPAPLCHLVLNAGSDAF